MSEWQGTLVADAAADEQRESGIRLRSAGRALLRELVRPYKRAIAGVLAIVCLQVCATMAGPWLVGVAIDTRCPTRGTATTRRWPRSARR